jgi:RHS repeat-associated protein
LDRPGRLAKVLSNGVAVLENWYDTKSRRVAKQEVVAGQTQKWLYLYDGWQIVAVINENGLTQETFTRGIGLGDDIGTSVAVTHHSGSGTSPGTYYIHHNHRGDVMLARLGTATSGTWDYTVFGSLKAQTGTDVCRFTFSSKERDRSTGFSYYGFRFYAPAWQRWPSADPSRENGGFNLYGFVSNDPLQYLDHLGLDNPGCDPPGDNAIKACPCKKDCMLRCCAEHDKCYYDNGCSAWSWILELSPECAACNAVAVGCMISCKTGKGKQPTGPRWFCPNGPNAGTFYDDYSKIPASCWQGGKKPPTPQPDVKCK